MTFKMGSVAALFVCSLVVVGAPCRAEEKHEKAVKAFEAGVSFYNEGRYDLACPLFDEAYALRPSWKLWYNIGQCQAALKNYGVALDAFDNYLVGGGDELDTRRIDSVMAEMRRLKGLVAQISISGPDGAKIYVDERYRGEIPETPIVRVTAGKPHTVEIRVDDNVWLARRVKLGSGQLFELSGKSESTVISAKQDEPAAPQRESNEDEAPQLDDSGQVEISNERKPVATPIFWSSVGATAGLGLAAGISSIVAEKKYDDAKGTEKDSAERESLSRAQTVARVFAITAGAALVTTAVLAFFTDFGSDEEGVEGQTFFIGPGHVGWMRTF